MFYTVMLSFHIFIWQTIPDFWTKSLKSKNKRKMCGRPIFKAVTTTGAMLKLVKRHILVFSMFGTLISLPSVLRQQNEPNNRKKND